MQSSLAVRRLTAWGVGIPGGVLSDVEGREAVVGLHVQQGIEAGGQFGR